MTDTGPDSPLIYWRRRLAELEAIPEPTFADRLNKQTARVIVGDLESRNLGGKA